MQRVASPPPLIFPFMGLLVFIGYMCVFDNKLFSIKH